MAASDWCRIVEHEGAQVLITHQFNDEDEQDEIRCTFMARDFGLPDVEVNLNIGASEEGFSEAHFASLDHEALVAEAVNTARSLFERAEAHESPHERAE